MFEAVLALGCEELSLFLVEGVYVLQVCYHGLVLERFVLVLGK
jgi:hypothetical protein